METPKEGKKQLKISTINGEEEAHSQYAMQLVSGSVLPMVLKAAIEFGVLDIIHRDCPGALLSPSQIASQLRSLHNPDCSLTRVQNFFLFFVFKRITSVYISNYDLQVKS